MFKVRLEPQGWQFEAPPQATLMQAARAAGIALPRSCQNGSCRACLSHLLAGQVRHTLEWPSLSVDEKAEGCILPCVAVALSDVVMASTGATRNVPTP
jgi:ferredoxin